MMHDQPDIDARIQRVAELLRQYPGVAEQPDATIEEQAWHLVHYEIRDGLAGRIEDPDLPTAS